jgi:hypothetical protein
MVPLFKEINLHYCNVESFTLQVFKLFFVCVLDDLFCEYLVFVVA